MSSAPSTVPSFVQALDQGSNPFEAIQAGRETLKQFTEHQFSQYDQGAAVAELVKERSTFIDQILKKIWHHFIPAEVPAALLAVGGYGRGELHPYSDIDVLILTDEAACNQEAFSQFITFLWDLGFDVGHALRTVDECVSAGLEDVATATNLLESRWITGDYELYEGLMNIWNRSDFWPSQTFFQAKFAEQETRHKRFNDTTYQLEPNVKESPGGLRDIQTVYWVAKRHYKASSINQLLQHQFLTTEEYREIEAAYKYLNRVRFALHRFKKRREDRLLFDHQQHIAETFGYQDTDEKMAVEQFMNSYYRNVQNVVKLNEILLQHFREEIFNSGQPEIKKINTRFKTVDQYLDIQHPEVFKQFPSALLEIFLILQHYPEIEGIRSHTIRSIRDNLHLIDEDFRNDTINNALFIEIFRQPHGVNAAIKRMHSYGILSAYLPVFKKISGLMQFNIFHAYTVDDHTILVIRNLRRFFVDEFAYEYPTAHQIAKSICKPEILFLAGLFHDIAKGRGGAHEVLGAEDALEFADQHNLSEKDGLLLSWLVRHHLEFSGIAQKKDLSNPEVIHHFAELVKDHQHLDYLYLLTVADVCATSDDVWNDWKNALFLELYNETSKVLDERSSTPKNRAKKALQTQERAKDLLAKRDLRSLDYQPFWDSLNKTEFFSRQTPNDVARITKLLYRAELDQIHIHLQNQTQRGATELMIYMPDRDYLFAHISSAMDKLHLNIMEARIYSTQTKMMLVILYILDNELHSISDKQMHKAIVEKIQQQLALPEIEPHEVQPFHNSRRVRCFETPTEISFHKINKHLSELSIQTKDIPGLLSRIGLALKTCNIRIHDAKINTVGEKAEDVFLISDTHDRAITEQTQKDKLIQALLDLIET
ncbi:[protein-PII] uridylyltransferase [Thiomicrorhabdus chilensis]|uniref:[protein-PII] uridylyltransferase n=1 Tax=Thiomicrorhabdus chilensis TaxID=63656 RepID=UPI00041504A7|nr:[protein-PII] uridylyltransferase [Thiomicrorhabdus chilensis]